MAVFEKTADHLNCRTLSHQKAKLGDINGNPSCLDVTNQPLICIPDMHHHSRLDTQDDLGTASMIRGDSELTSVHPKELSARAPPVPPLHPPLFNPARAPARTLQTGRRSARNLCLSTETRAVIFPAHHTSCSLLTATAALYHP